jgi:hypothetical protein
MSDKVQPDQQFEKIWQKVPQEERNEILVQAQSKAAEICTLVAIFSSAATFGLHIPAIALGAAVVLPLLYQVVVSRAVIELKPQIVARYFIANRTARLYALTLHSAEPTPKALFRGSLLPILEQAADSDPELTNEYTDERLDFAANQKEVWISLFPDRLIMFSENKEGSRLEFSSSISNGFSMTLESPEDLSGNPLPQQLIIETTHPTGTKKSWILNSRHTSSLLMCERKVRLFSQLATQRAQESSSRKPLPDSKRSSHSLFASKQLGATLEAVSHG